MADRPISGHAELIRVDSIDDSLAAFVEQGADALAGLRPRLMRRRVDAAGCAHSWTASSPTCSRAIGTPKANLAAAAFLQDFVADAEGERAGCPA